MEVFQTDKYYIFVKNEKSLWWNRTTSEFNIKSGWDLSSVDDIECIGITHGIIGVFGLQNVYDSRLVIIKEATEVGVLYPPHLVYKIKSICVLSTDAPDTILSPCPKHLSNSNSPTHTTTSTSTGKIKLLERNQLMNKTWGAVKIAGNTIKNTTQQAAAIASNQVKSSVGIRDPTRIEKRITDDLHKIFDDTDSFYYCFDADITNNLQRIDDEIDERFFWNQHMIKDIITLNDKTWILPIIQGFVQVEPCVIGNEYFTLAIVSRRSRWRSGTRYKRRGIDAKGNCANYVETEQILSFRHHLLSLTQVRGSVPVYWSQPGYKYRPPPRLDKNEEETQEAFKKHFDNEINIYKKVCIVNLVEASGKEKMIGDAFTRHVLKYDNENLIYVTFDFHDYCRGMRFQNVSTLVEALAPEIVGMGFHWRDQRGVICNQKTIFRVNCMDCLDRTNVVQTALAKAVLESQLVKLGLTPPYTPMPEQLKTPFMVLWANNGDIISRQYAGTNALKGDYTRTGERKISGIMKDGMNSANRYYLARFKDSYRQATIDIMLGNPVTAESLNTLGTQTIADENETFENAEHAKLLVEDCLRLFSSESTQSNPVGSWGLINADPFTGDSSETEIDSILLLSNDSYIVAEYDSHLDKIVRFERVCLKNLLRVELGTYQQAKLFQTSSPSFQCLRLNYKLNGADGYYHMLRSANMRFFNSTVTVVKTSEEILESFMLIVDMFRIILKSAGIDNVEFKIGGSLQNRKSKNSLLEVPKGIPRNLSESQLVQMSSKAFSNVAGQFSKLGQSLNPNKTSTNNSNEKLKTNDDTITPPTKATFFVTYNSKDSTEMDDNEFDCSDVVKSNINENHFLPSVGIVMSTKNECNKLDIEDAAECYENADNINQKFEDVLTMSISSVTDHITLPSGTLESDNTQVIRSKTPEICLPDERGLDIGEEIKSLSQQNLNTLTGSNSNLTNELSEGDAVKSAGAFSKFTKGVQNIGLSLDPRKLAAKTNILSPSNDIPVGVEAIERDTIDRTSILKLWKSSKCKTKLIAL